jgi:ComF family protein
MLLATTCPVCGARGTAPCARCAAALRGAPLLPPPAGVDVAAAVLAYEGAGRELVARLKYRNQRAALPALASAMAALVPPASVDVVTWVPTTAARRHARGFDQAELLARAVARRLRRPCRGLLHRRVGPAQTGQAVAARRAGPTLSPRRRLGPRRVLLVDDVITTGATVAAAAAALRDAGAASVSVVAAARTPFRDR